MRNGPYVPVQEIAKELVISKSAAYALMHELGAVHVGKGALRRGRGSLRLDRRRWLRYLDQIACNLSNATENTAPSATTPTPAQVSEDASCALQVSVSTAPKKRSARPSTAGAKSRQSSTGPKVSPALAAAVAKARLPSHSPSLQQLKQLASQARAKQA